jgi:hypothetical protein
MSEEIPEQAKKVDNEYDFLRKRALDLSKKGRDGLSEAEYKFYCAIRKLEKLLLLRSYHHEYTEDINSIIKYPNLLREILDREEEARDCLEKIFNY